MRILITGASGNLGERLCESLSHLNYFELLKGSRTLSNDGKYVQLEYDNLNSLCNILHGVDVIINLGMPDRETCEKNDKVIGNEVEKNISNLAIAANIARVRHIIHASTSHVYGPLVGKIDERSPLNPQSTYAVNHCIAEAILQNSKKHYSLTVLRLSNVVGNFGKNSRSLFAQDLISNLLENKFANIRSNINTERNFLSFSDFSKAISFFLKNPENKKWDDVFNIGGKKTWKLIDFAELITSRVSKIKNISCELIVHESEPLHTPPFVYSIDKLLGFGVRPDSDLVVEIDKMILSSLR